MIRNRTSQLIYQTVYCTLALIGLLSSLGCFDADFNESFYVYYTNLSNYICMGMMLVFLVRTAQAANKKEDGFCETAPTFNFICVIMILVTLLVYNLLLANEHTVVEYFTSLRNLLMHLILPTMFVGHWVLFCKHGKMKWYQPLLCLILPLIYVAFILIRAAVLGAGSDAVRYPYFFLNVEKLGWNGVFAWIGVLLAVFTVIGYILYALDSLGAVRAKNGLPQAKP